MRKEGGPRGVCTSICSQAAETAIRVSSAISDSRALFVCTCRATAFSGRVNVLIPHVAHEWRGLIRSLLSGASDFDRAAIAAQCACLTATAAFGLALLLAQQLWSAGTSAHAGDDDTNAIPTSTMIALSRRMDKKSLPQS
jgi:hypothetical protein